MKKVHIDNIIFVGMRYSKCGKCSNVLEDMDLSNTRSCPSCHTDFTACGARYSFVGDEKIWCEGVTGLPYVGIADALTGGYNLY